MKIRCAIFGERDLLNDSILTEDFQTEYLTDIFETLEKVGGEWCVNL